MQRSFIRLLFISFSLIATSDIFAQQQYGFSKKVGDADIYPAVRLDYISTSNVFRSSDNETEASSVRVTPEFLLLAGTGQYSLEAEYKGEYNSSDVSAASYADHSLRFETNAELSSRFRTGANLALSLEHQEIGTDLTRAIANENTDAVEFNRANLNLFGVYGAAQARGNVTLGLTIDALSFTNQPALTDGRSYSSVEPYGVFSLRLSPDLRALAELRFASLSFDSNLRDRSETTILFGLNIAASRKLSGQIKLGTTLTDYEDDQFRDLSELTIRTNLKYEPVDYSVFSLVVDRETDRLSANAAAVNAVSITDRLQLNWVHEWSSRFFHRASLTRLVKNDQCPSVDIITNSASYELTLKFRRWLELGVGGSSGNREAGSCDGPDDAAEDFDLTRVGVHLRATL